MKPREIASLFKEASVRWWNDNAFRLSASLAFYTIFSLAPLLLIAVFLAGVLFGEETATRHLIGQVSGLVGPQGARAVETLLQSTRDQPDTPIAAITGVVLLLLGSTAVFAELQSALNQIWDVEPAPRRGRIRSVVRTRVVSFAVVLGVGFLLLVSLAVSAFLAGMEELLSHRLQDLPTLWRGVNAVMSLLVAVLLFGLIYKVLPDVELSWSDVVIGAFVTALLFGIGKYAIGAYLGQMAFSSRFGAAGSFVVLLFWVYYSALIAFFGAEFTHVYARRRGHGIQPVAHARRRHAHA